MKDLWYKNAIVYALDVKTYKDTDGDGKGDFKGLISRLNHIAGLGVTCIWLLPFYPSPNADNGYDVADYFGIHPELGSLGDFAEFMNEAKNFGIRVIVDLVVNHTSDEHPWFQMAREDKNSPYRDFYVWSKKKPATPKDKIIFTGKQDTIWTYDKKAEEYYLHRYMPQQPDLNIANPKVQEEILKIMGFWLALGVSGFRVDSVHIMVETIGMDNLGEKELYDFLNKMHNFLSNRSGDGVLIAEVDAEAAQLNDYFGQNNRMHMLFNFHANQFMFLALAREDARPLEKTLKELHKYSPAEEWLNFVRHHDELNLKMLTVEERKDVFKAFAPEEDMQVFGHGIRRRLPPMLKGNRQQIELVYSLTFSLPGIPMLREGEEIGMGEDLELEGRMSIRTPMQWTNGKNAGFSTAPAKNLIRPVIDKGDFSYQKVNVIDQLPDRDSLMNWMKGLISIRKKCFAIGWGEFQIYKTDNKSVFAHSSEWEDNLLVIVHNLAGISCEVKIECNISPVCLVDIFSDQKYKRLSGKELKVPIEAYGYRWLLFDKFQDENCV